LILKRALTVLAAGAITVLPARLALPNHAAAASAYTLSPVQYGVELRTPDGRVVFEYMTKKPDNIGLTSPSAACFHPVNTPSGERITSIAPDDHPHHRGIFFGWHDSEFREPVVFGPNSPATHALRGFNVRRADFWGWGTYAPRDGRLVQNREAKLVSADSQSARIVIQNDWLIENRKMANESDAVSVAERDGVYVLDLEYLITPVVDYVLNRSAFGGFDVQCRKDGDSYYSTAAGNVTLPDPHYSYPELDWPSEPWYDFTIRLSGNGKVLGAAVIDHPLNPPTLWHNARSLWMLNPSITAFGQVTIRPDAPLKLRYRVVVHDGPPPVDVLQKLSAEWRGR
jgi:hypothetical protein